MIRDAGIEGSFGDFETRTDKARVDKPFRSKPVFVIDNGHRRNATKRPEAGRNSARRCNTRLENDLRKRQSVAIPQKLLEVE